MIRPATSNDADQIAALYNYYVENTVITFEEALVTSSEMARRIESVSATHPWLVSEQVETVMGYAYAAPWHARSAYRLSVETTVYLDPDQLHRGLGGLLYTALIDELRNREFHAAISCIALPNEASVVLHEKLGFEKVAEFKEVGWKFDKWIDVGYWQLIL